MSLHNLASQLQSAGRGEDKVLVHMTPKEVGGLQSLAMAHGGSLTINPQTGLPEAGFLSKMLPMIAGFALAPATGGASLGLTQAWQTAALVGGVTGLATGSLKKGLMAGLGAYGGAGLGQGLAAAGSTAAGSTAATNTAAQLAPTVPPVPPVAEMGVVPSPANLTTPGLSPLAQTQQNILSTIAPPATPPTTSMVTTPSVPSAPVYNSPPVPAAAPPNMPQGATGYVYDGSTNGYTYTGPGGYPVATPSTAAVSGGPTSGSYYSGPGDVGGYARSAVPADATQVAASPSKLEQLRLGAKESFGSTKGLSALSDSMTANTPYSKAALGISALDAARNDPKMPEKDKSLIRPYEYSYNATGADQEASSGSAERTYFNPTFTALTPYEAPGPEYKAVGGAVEDMSAQNSLSGNLMYPQANLQTDMYANPAIQRPMGVNIIKSGMDAPVNPYSGEARFAEGGKTAGKYWSGTAWLDSNPKAKGSSAVDEDQPISYNYDPKTMQFSQAGAKKTSGGMAFPIMQPQAPAQPMMQPVNIPAYQTPEQQLGLGGFYDTMNQQLGQMGGYQGYAAGGGISHLGGYSDGGRLLRGPGDGVSDSIPAQIGEKQPARLADGEFILPARIVSEIGNGSTEAGARKLYAMMDRVQKARGKTTGKNRVAVDSKADKLLPA